MQAHAMLFPEAVRQVHQQAVQKLPALTARLDKAAALVLHGGVWLDADGTCQVRSSDGTTWYRTNGTCTCPHGQHHPDDYCCHRLAYGLYRRASELMQDPPMAIAAAVQETPTHGIPAQYVTHLHGKPFVRYAGLLAMAHERGLVSLKARFISVTADLALAEADATFADGTTYSECADSTPQNVPPHIRPHFPRMALTRCKARCLRDALNISTLLQALVQLGILVEQYGMYRQPEGVPQGPPAPFQAKAPALRIPPPAQPQGELRRHNGRYWAVYDSRGMLVCVALYRKGAEEVLRRLGGAL